MDLLLKPRITYDSLLYHFGTFIKVSAPRQSQYLVDTLNDPQFLCIFLLYIVGISQIDVATLDHLF